MKSTHPDIPETALRLIADGLDAPSMRRDAARLIPAHCAATRPSAARDPAPNARSLAQRLRARPWHRTLVPPELVAAPTMLSVEERAVLRYLAAEEVTGRGQVVDAGAFLGGSSLALAGGLAENPHAEGVRVHAYDLFLMTPVAVRLDYPELRGRAVGESNRDVFERTIGPVRDRVVIHEGDIRADPWSGEPIEVLFIDIAKTWDTNDHVMRDFLPHLIPDGGVLIQQDWIHEKLPWIHISMELLDDAFDLVATMPNGSAVFVPRRAVRAEEIPRNLRADVPDEDKLTLFDRVVRRHEGEERGIIEGARARLLVDLGREDDAHAHLESLAATYADSPAVQASLERLRVSDFGRE